MPPSRLVPALILAGLTAACAAPAPDCRALGGGQPMLVAELLYGRNQGGRLRVTDADWQVYVADELTTRFPDGLTVVDALGQWQDSGGRGLVREPSKLVLIATAPGPETDAKLTGAINAYKQRFAQDSVGLIRRQACVAF
jgi:hypothetical protein